LPRKAANFSLFSCERLWTTTSPPAVGAAIGSADGWRASGAA
jgi:hypothetical protein